MFHLVVCYSDLNLVSEGDMVMMSRTIIRLVLVLLIWPWLAFAPAASAQTPLGGLPFPGYADFVDPGDQFGGAISADGSWMDATGSNGEAF